MSVVLNDCDHIFGVWYGMADLIDPKIEDYFDIDFYTNLNLDDEQQLVQIIKQDILPYFNSARINFGPRAGLNFLEEMISNPDGLDLERLFDSHLIIIPPPKNLDSFYKILYRELVTNQA